MRWVSKYVCGLKLVLLHSSSSLTRPRILASFSSPYQPTAERSQTVGSSRTRHPMDNKISDCIINTSHIIPPCNVFLFYVILSSLGASKMLWTRKTPLRYILMLLMLGRQAGLPSVSGPQNPPAHSLRARSLCVQGKAYTDTCAAKVSCHVPHPRPANSLWHLTSRTVTIVRFHLKYTAYEHPS
jgi:hypothetical protein